jgi:DNA-binding PucR family transcriptional regulator
MILRDLVDHPTLGLTLLHGRDRLDRTVGAAFTTDLLNPRRYLTRDAVVLSGLMWRHAPSDSDTFVRALADAGVVALAAGEAAFGTIPDDVVEACRRHDLPLISVPVDVSFARVADLVAADREADRERALTAALGRQRRLLAAVADGCSIDELLVLVERDVGVGCRVLTPTGRHVATTAGQIHDADADLASRAFLAADRLPVTIYPDSGSPVSIVAVDSRLENRLTAWFLVCDGDHAQWSEEAAATIRELATVIAVEHRRWDERRRTERRIADEVIALVATGHAADAEVTVRMADLGARPDGPCLIAAAARPGPVEVAGAVLHDAALHVDDRPVSGVHDGRAVTILTGGRATDSHLLRAALRRVAPGVGKDRLVAGLSAWVAPDAMSAALDEAVHAVRLAELRGAAVSVVTSDDVTSHVLLLGTVPDDVRHAFANRVLGVVHAYDANRGSDLMGTLDAFLRADCSWSRCAEDLHVHVNTVRYRIRQVEKLTGRDLSRLDDRIDVVLALRSLRPGDR